MPCPCSGVCPVIRRILRVRCKAAPASFAVQRVAKFFFVKTDDNDIADADGGETAVGIEFPHFVQNALPLTTVQEVHVRELDVDPVVLEKFLGAVAVRAGAEGVQFDPWFSGHHRSPCSGCMQYSMAWRSMQIN